MKHLLVGLVAALSLATIAQSSAQDSSRSVTAGRVTYLFSCAVCHGPEGKGEDAAASDLAVPPPDLTTIAQRNGGVFPESYVTRVIAGGAAETAHGGPMPAWGLIFLNEFNAFTFDTSRGDVQRVQKRIDDLVVFLRSIQEPAL